MTYQYTLPAGDVDSAYTALFDALTTSSLLLKSDAPRYTIIAASPLHLQHGGVKKQDIIGKGLFDAYPSNPDVPGRVGEMNLQLSLDHVLSHKNSHQLPVQRYDVADDTGRFAERYWRVENKPVLGVDGEVAYILHTVEELTEQIKAEAKESKIRAMEMVNNLFRQTPIPVCLFRGPELIVEIANEPTLRLWGRTEKVIGLPLAQAVPEVKGQGFAELMQEVIRTGIAKQVYESPVTLVRNGEPEVLYTNYIYEPYYEEGESNAVGVLAIGNDVTDKIMARKKGDESEAKYRALFDSMDQGFCVIEMIFDENMNPIDYIFLEANPVFEMQTGLKDPVGKRATQLVPDLEPHWFSAYGKVALTGKSRRFTEGSAAMGRWFDVYAFKIGQQDSFTVALLFSDITERRKAEEAIRLTESNLRNTILQAPVAMAILRGPRFIVELANSHMYELWGRGQSEILNRSIFEGLPEVKDQGYEELLSAVFNTGQRFTAPGLPVTLPRNGKTETVYINLLYEAYREGDGSISGVIAVATDVTEQVLNRKVLEENEATLQKRVAERTRDLQQQQLFIRSILEATFDGIYALKAIRDAEGVITDFRYLFANNNIVKLLNLEVNEVIGASMLTLIPENRENGFFKFFCQSLQHRQTLRDETYFVTQAINNWYEYVITPIDEDTLVVSTRDISEKKAAQLRIEEQRNLLDSILKNSSNGISVSQVHRNEEGVVVDAITILANEAAVKYIGLPREIYLSKKATEIEPGIIGSPYYQACINTLRSGEPFMMQYRMESTHRWLELTVSRLDEDHLIHVFTDVTAVKEAQLELERTVEELRRSNESLEEFAYAASHDLKEPIRKIQFYTSQIKTQVGGSPMGWDIRSFNRIEYATQRMGKLIDDLLLYSHVTQRPHEREQVDLNDELKQVTDDLEIDIREKRALIHIGSMPVVQGYRTQLRQLFQNLISNALKYSKTVEPPHIHIAASNVVTDGRAYCEISVKDNGIGFDQKYAQKIFQMFSRLHSKNEYSGTGVGLSIVKKVVANHNGFVQAESEPGEGSVFKIYLPV